MMRKKCYRKCEWRWRERLHERMNAIWKERVIEVCYGDRKEESEMI